MQDYTEKTSWLDRPLFSKITLNLETILFSLILIVAIVTRFYDLSTRVMSHDETSHVYFSWLLHRGQGYSHDPVTHGPFQFHIVALSYFLFGDNDTSARLPAALFSIAIVAFMWNFRRYLGRAGGLVAAFLMTISPFMLYYGRYVRNEVFVGLFGVMTLWAILRYLETGQTRFLYWLTAVSVLHFATKETAFIYTAQALLFLALFFIYRITQQKWARPEYRNLFLIFVILALILLTVGVLLNASTQEPVTPSPAGEPPPSIPPAIPNAAFIAGGLGLAAAVYLLIRGYTLPLIRTERSFDLVVLLGTLVLPQLSPFLINFAGWKIPVNASEVINLTATDILRMAVFIVPMALLSIGVGLWWNRRQWLINAAIFYAIFTVLFTTVFTNGAGFFTGLVGSLGYWLAQQAVYRGSQPWYYYAAIQIPIYEYLPALGSLLALVLALRRRPSTPTSLATPETGGSYDDNKVQEEGIQTAPTLSLLSFWVITSLIAYTIAGEKMPWLTYHIALPMILLSGWSFGHLIETFDWNTFRSQRGWLVIALLPVFMTSLLAVFGSLAGNNQPFQGKSLEQLSATSTFILSLLTTIASGVGLGYLLKDWVPGQISRAFALTFLSLLALLTARTAFTAAYINYDRATEYLVYAHSGPGVKEALAQIEEISRRTAGGLEMVVAFDNDTTYPYWWYLRNYPNQRYYAGNPTRDLRDVPAILVGDNNFGKLEPVVGQAYYRFDYIRIWWPNQDYYNLTWERISNALRDPNMRAALFQIWLNRDYTRYSQITGSDFSLSNWNPSGRMRLYLRKDIAAQMWNYGTSPAPETIVADPYDGKQISLNADRVIGLSGAEPGQFQKPKGVAVAPDGSLYVSDAFNHRIQHFALDGSVLNVWGSFADVAKGEAPGGTFYEPWGIAVGPDGSVYVADTWNHRIQKFTADGKFILMWGFFGTAETPFALWGPRDVSIDSQGNVFVTDTGNKRIVVFDSDGQYLTQFGSVGFEPGQFDEPVGIAIDSNGLVYIADTWNQRLQVMVADISGNYVPLRNWEIVAWYGQSLDNKPYLAVGQRGHVFITDPEGYRVLEFTNNGEFVRFWGDYGAGAADLSLPTGIVADMQGGLWVADSGNNRIVHYTLPTD